MEVLYEDPKEDSVSILSSEEVASGAVSTVTLATSADTLATSASAGASPAPNAIASAPSTNGDRFSFSASAVEDFRRGVSVPLSSSNSVQHPPHRAPHLANRHSFFPSASLDDLDQRKDTLQSWRQLEEEIRDLHDLIAEFSNIVVGGVRNYFIFIIQCGVLCVPSMLFDRHSSLLLLTELGEGDSYSLRFHAGKTRLSSLD